MVLISRICLLLLMASAAFGQTVLATVTGTISDSTGAVIVDAPVEIRNLDTGALFRASSSATGNYSVSQLPVGDYDFTITVTGFKTYQRTRFHLSAAQTLRENVTLEVGQSSESVTVTAETSLLKTENTEVAHNVTLTQLNNLPVLPIGATTNGFRDPFNAVRLVPGVRYLSAGGVTTAVINGTPANTYQIRLDGATQTPSRPGLVGATMQVQPSVDAIEEVAVQTSNFAAEFGTAGGAVVNMTAKSGTNQYHGSAYDYATNEALNARTPYLGTRNKTRLHDFGFTVGGPVRIPKLYDGTNKTFFFWSYERYRSKSVVVNPTNGTVPTPEYRAGNFVNLLNQVNNRPVCGATGTGPAGVAAGCPSNGRVILDPLGRTIFDGAIFDPASQRTVQGSSNLVRDAFVGNQIPLNRFDPVAAKVLALVPLPVGPNADKGQAGQNYQAPYPNDRISTIPSIKIDQSLGSKHKVSFYIQETNTGSPRSPVGADSLPDFVSGSIVSDIHATTIRTNYDWTMTSRLLFHFTAAWNDDDFSTLPTNQTFDAQKELGISGQTAAGLFPRIVTGAGSAAVGGMSSLGGSSYSKNWERRPSGNASVSYVTGSHTVKFGAEYRREIFPENSLLNTTGTYNFNTNWTQQTALQGIATNQGSTGNALASFLLGGVSSATISQPLSAMTRKSQSSLFLQDNWKVTRKLTMDYGIRWDYGTYAREQYGRYSSLGLSIPNPSAGGRLGARQYEAICNCNFADNYPFAIGPRVGAAYQVNSKTVFRGGFGIVYNTTSTSAGGNVNLGSSPGTAPGQIAGEFRNGLPSDTSVVWPSFEPNAGQAVGAVIGAPTYLDPNAGRPARLFQWSATLQREINRDLVVEAAYVANRGVWWSNGNGLENLNALTEPYMRTLFPDFTKAADGTLLNSSLASASTTLANRGIRLMPYSNFPTTQTVTQALRPYPQFTGAITPAGAPLGNSWYDAFQLTVNKRFSHGVQFNMNYTFSKTLELYSADDIFNRGVGKDYGGFDNPHLIRLNLLYQVPQINSSLPVLSNKIVAYALSGWGLGWYSTYQSAGVLGRPAHGAGVPISQFLGGRGPGGAQLKKDANGEYMNPWSVNWVDNSGKQRTDPIDINCHCFDPTKTVALNPDAWETVPNGQWAADQQSLRFFRGTRLPQESANFSRNFRLKESINLNVRVEFSNIFNRMQLPSPSSGGNFATAPTRFASGPNAGLYSGGFGTYSVVNGLTGARAGTFIARVTF